MILILLQKFWNMRRLILLTITLSFASIVNAQNITSKDTRAWLGYITQSRICNRFSLWNDAHWVSHGFGIVRTGLSYHFNNKSNIITTLGYAHLWIYPAPGKETFRPEHRAWGQTTATQKLNNFNFFHRLRYEARFRRTIVEDHLMNEFNFNYRTRYLFQTKYNLTQNKEAKQKYYGLISDEVAYNFGKEVKNGFRLDQNRISLGAGCVIKNITLQLAYLNQLSKAATTKTYSMNHHAQFLVFHNFDFRKKTEKK